MSRNTKVLVALGGVIALALAIYLRARPDSAITLSNANDVSFATIVKGDDQSRVRGLLGTPSGETRRELISQLLTESECTRLRPARAEYFYRTPRPSFVVYYDENNKVVCKEARELAIHVR